MCYYGEAVLAVILISVLLAFVLAPVVDFLSWLHLPRGLAAFVAIALLLVAIAGTVYYSYNQAVVLVQDLPKYTTRLREEVMRFRKQAESLETLGGEPEEKGVVNVRSATSWNDLLTRGFGSASTLLLACSFIPFLTFFMLTWQQHVRSATVMLFPLENRNTVYVMLGLISAMIRSFMVGNLLIGLVLGAASTLVFGVLHLPFFYFVGFISGFLSLVPYMGLLLAMVPPDFCRPRARPGRRPSDHAGDHFGTAHDRPQRPLPQVPGQPAATESAGRDHELAGVGRAVGSHGPGPGHPHYRRHEDRL